MSIDLWQLGCDRLAAELPEHQFNTWIRPLPPALLSDDGKGDAVACVRVPNRFKLDWIRAQYAGRIESVLSELAGRPVRLELTLAPRDGAAGFAQAPRTDDTSTAGRGQETRPAPAGVSGSQRAVDAISLPAQALSVGRPPTASMAPSATRHKLNSALTFDTLVAGRANQMARTAALHVAGAPGQSYNPLFIYGGVGLGKTHLVNAVGHRVLENTPHARVLYLSAERFTNEFIWALQNHRINEFRERYRNNCDVLLMDDIQFLAGREQTQEEFFHTFNALYHADRQIVVTSDVYPQQIPEMQERLISRFQWGLVADIQAPELDTRIAILKRKAEEESIALADDVALFLAQVVKSNVRELEGTLLRLAVRAELVKRPIDLEFARETLKAVLPAPEHAVSVEDIQTATCKYFSIRLADLKSHRRHRAVSYPRMVAMYLCRQRLGTSYPQLGELFGGKDHTTVLSAVNKIGGLLKNEDPKLRGEIEAIERKLGL